MDKIIKIEEIAKNAYLFIMYFRLAVLRFTKTTGVRNVKMKF